MGVWRSVVSRLKLWAPDDTRAPAENGRCDNRSMDDLAGTHETSTNSGPVYLLRNRGQFVKGGALVAFSLFIFISSVIDPAPGSLLAPTLIALGIVGLATAFFFLPRLIVDGQGCTSSTGCARSRCPGIHITTSATALGWKSLQMTALAVPSLASLVPAESRLAETSSEGHGPQASMPTLSDTQCATPGGTPLDEHPLRNR